MQNAGLELAGEVWASVEVVTGDEECWGCGSREQTICFNYGSSRQRRLLPTRKIHFLPHLANPAAGALLLSGIRTCVQKRNTRKIWYLHQIAEIPAPFFPVRNQANIVFSFATKGYSNSQGNQYVCIWSQEHWAQKRQWSGVWITGVMSREHRDRPLHLAWGETHSLADQLFRQTEWGGSVGILFRASKKDFDLQRRKMMICLILFNIWTMPCSGKLAVVPHKSLALWEGRAAVW